MATQDEYVRTALRVPRDLHERLHEAAKEQGHSFNAEIIRRLEYAFQHPPAVWIAGLAKEENELKAKAAERDELRAAIRRMEQQIQQLIAAMGGSIDHVTQPARKNVAKKR